MLTLPLSEKNRKIQAKREIAANPLDVLRYSLFLFWTIKQILYRVSLKTNSLCRKLYKLRYGVIKEESSNDRLHLDATKMTTHPNGGEGGSAQTDHITLWEEWCWITKT